MVDWIERFRGLGGLEAGVRARLIAESKVIPVPCGARIFGPGQAPDNLLLLLEGTVRVQQLAESGREIVLYRVNAGESCVLTTACLLAYEDYSAEGIAETDLKAVAIPRGSFERLIAESRTFRRFVFQAYSRRITDLCLIIEEVAFGRVDARLADRLLALAKGAPNLRVTHAELAAELGTAREVISRQLQEFQRRGWVRSGRGEIALRDTVALSTLAEGLHHS